MAQLFINRNVDRNIYFCIIVFASEYQNEPFIVYLSDPNLRMNKYKDILNYQNKTHVKCLFVEFNAF